jgi:hypothetical protein
MWFVGSIRPQANAGRSGGDPVSGTDGCGKDCRRAMMFVAHRPGFCLLAVTTGNAAAAARVGLAYEVLLRSSPPRRATLQDNLTTERAVK